MAQHFFIRREKKYLLSALEYSNLMHDLKDHIRPDQYHKASIYNVYFDTPNNDLVIKSLEQPNYKYKVRARSYGAASGDSVFLEIKSKLDGIVYKRRATIPKQVYESYIRGSVQIADGQVMKEIDHLFTELHLTPKLFIAYDRMSYIAREDPGLRLTFDSNLRSRSTNMNIANYDDCLPYFNDKTYIMEIKSKGGLPRWLVDTLNSREIYPSSFSKYGKIYQANMKREVAYA